VGDDLHEELELDEKREAATREERGVRCASCSHEITTERARIAVDGAHSHTFVNPQAIEFRIACFREAPGCIGWGEESTYWSWFKGYAWRVALCSSCAAHLGWSYRGGTSGFYGLIADRIVRS
jgi:hypothetical protein